MPGMMDTVLNLGLNDETVARAGQADQQRPLRLGRLPPLHPDVRPDRLGHHRPRSSTTSSTTPRQRRGAQAGHRPGRRPAAERSSASSSSSSSARPARPSRPTRSSSSSWRSRPSSARGWASARSTTATTTRSPTTWAPPSTSRRWSSATWATTPAPASPSPATRPPARTSSTASSWPTPRARTWSPASARRCRSRACAGAGRTSTRSSRRSPIGSSRPTSDVQDLEFTVERGKLFMLQTRNGKRTGRAAVKIAVDDGRRGPDHQGRGARRGSSRRTSSSSCCRASTSRPRPQPPPRALIGKGLAASPGAAVGKVVLRRRPGRASWPRTARRVILVRPETSPDDFHGMIVAAGHPDLPRRHVQPRGRGRARDGQAVHRRRRRRSASTCDGRNAHRRTARRSRKATVISHRRRRPARSCRPDRRRSSRLQRGDRAGRAAGLGGRDAHASASGPTPTPPRRPPRARELGAEGVGLCRTEHMFREAERLPIVRRMILAAPRRRSATVTRCGPATRRAIAERSRSRPGRGRARDA